jgi:hypothetical protein
MLFVGILQNSKFVTGQAKEGSIRQYQSFIEQNISKKLQIEYTYDNWRLIFLRD